MTQTAKTEKPWYKKTWVIIIGVIIVLGVIGNLMNKGKSSDPSGTSASSSNSAPEQVAAAPKKWVEVYSFKGNGMKKSPMFQLSGAEAKLKYTYKAPGGIGMGLFSVYVVDKGVDVMETGGIPEVMSQAETEDSESAIQKPAGDYYLNVNASGNWTVSVEEYK